jgi:hypothetical protein
MRRLLLAVLALTLALPALGASPEKWYDAYKRGVLAVNAKNYRDAVIALQRSIDEMPTESTGVKAGREIITYLPHFWIGIAKFNTGDVDGALRSLKTSEDQGVVTRTEYYATLKDWVARAKTEKQRNADSAATGPRKAADATLSRALEMQLAALRAGGDRTDSYAQAQRKLQDARTQFQKAGSDVGAYRAVEATANQAIAAFTAAAEEGQRLKDARAAAPPKKPARVIEISVPVEPTPAPVATATVAPQPQPEPTPAAESEARVAARLAVQQYRRNAVTAPKGLGGLDVKQAEKLRARVDTAKNDAELQQITKEASDRDRALATRVADLATPAPAVIPATTTAPAIAEVPRRVDLGPAYRAFAGGDLAGAERLLSGILASQQAPEAFLLRGCARYTRAMLSRDPASSLPAAESDFRAALQRDAKLRLDRNAFSPKLVAYFERVRGGR